MSEEQTATPDSTEASGNDIIARLTAAMESPAEQTEKPEEEQEVVEEATDEVIDESQDVEEESEESEEEESEEETGLSAAQENLPDSLKKTIINKKAK